MAFTYNSSASSYRHLKSSQLAGCSSHIALPGEVLAEMEGYDSCRLVLTQLRGLALARCGSRLGRVVQNMNSVTHYKYMSLIGRFI